MAVDKDSKEYILIETYQKFSDNARKELEEFMGILMWTTTLERKKLGISVEKLRTNMINTGLRYLDTD